MRQGIFTRGVLLDVAAARGVPWYESNEYVTVADFEAAEKRQNVRVSSGDALLVRTRHGAHGAGARPPGHLPSGGLSRRVRGVDASARSGASTAATASRSCRIRASGFRRRCT